MDLDFLRTLEAEKVSANAYARSVIQEFQRKSGAAVFAAMRPWSIKAASSMCFAA